MATTQVDICNLALRRLGANTITSISESTKMAEHCNAFWDYVLDEVLEAIPWNFTKKTRTLDFATGFGYYDEDTDTKTITGISQASEAVVTCVAHGFSTGHTVYIYDVAGMTQVNERVFEVENATADTFKLTDIDSQIFDAYTSGGSCYRKEVDPKYSSGYTYDLPTDYKRCTFPIKTRNLKSPEPAATVVF
jgi:hypothetical protein